MSLVEYERKRQFDRTREPAAKRRSRGKGRPIFVVQLHHASHRHYDFRLQVGGALRSWAVPKGPSFDPAVKRLAAEVEDHPLAYAKFEGEIPEGQYGGGHVALFDQGLWSTDGDAEQQLAKGHLRFELFGDKLKGGWHLIRTRGTSRKPQWLLVKDKDRYAGKGEADDLAVDLPAPTSGASARRAAKKAKQTVAPPRKAQPTLRAQKLRDWTKHAAALDCAEPASLPTEAPAPQLAMMVDKPPEGPGWLHEIKWDGYRFCAMIRDGRVDLWSRNGVRWTTRLPDIIEALQSLRLRDAILDGELIAGQGTRDDFTLLQATLAGDRNASLSFVLFDVLYLDGSTLVACTLDDRKALLARILDPLPSRLALSAHAETSGAEAYAAATRHGFEGIVSKRADGRWHAGRSDDWRKSKHRDSQEFAVVGSTPPKGKRTGLGALLLARYDPNQGWLYAGKAGSGLSELQLKELGRKIGRAGSAKPSVIVPPNDTDLRQARWFAPRFLVEVHSRGLGSNGLLRQPSIKAVRLDKTVNDMEKARPKKDGVTITHPDRVVFPRDGITKQQVADYYLAVMPELLKGIDDRPLSVIRCPGGIEGACFFQKHEMAGIDGVDHVRLKEKSGGQGDYLVARDEHAVMSLVQFNTIEFHPWGAHAGTPDLADMLVFDLDPGPGVEWNAVKASARQVRERLQQAGLESFVRTSGGKGLHVVVPLNPPSPWDIAKPFAQAFAATMARLDPDRYVATATKSRRKGRIFIDYLRNGRGATSVASYSLRARPGAPVATPLSWQELTRVRGPAAFTLHNIPNRLKRQKTEPWQGFSKTKQGLQNMLAKRTVAKPRQAKKPTS